MRFASAGLLHQRSDEEIKVAHHGGFILRLQPAGGINVGQSGTHPIGVVGVMHRRVVGEGELRGQFVGTRTVEAYPAVLPRLLLIGSIPDQLAWPGKKQLTLAHFPGASAHLEYALAGKYQMDQVMVADTRPPCLARSTAFDAAIEDGKLNIIGIILFEGLLIYICHSRVSSALSRCGQLCARSLV